MGDLLSTLSSSQNPNHSTQPTNPTMASSNPSQTHYSSPQTAPPHQLKTQEESSHPPQIEPIHTQENDTVLEEAEENNEKQEEQDEEKEEEEEEEEEEGECGFCLFMKGGGCREVFIEWEKCIEEGEMNKQDIMDKCHNVTKALKECMEAHPDYYGPILQAEAEAVKGLEREKEGNEGSDSASKERKEREVGDGELGSVSESVATIEVEGGENSGGAEREQSS